MSSGTPAFLGLTPPRLACSTSVHLVAPTPSTLRIEVAPTRSREGAGATCGHWATAHTSVLGQAGRPGLRLILHTLCLNVNLLFLRPQACVQTELAVHLQELADALSFRSVNRSEVRITRGLVLEVALALEHNLVQIGLRVCVRVRCCIGQNAVDLRIDVVLVGLAIVVVVCLVRLLVLVFIGLAIVVFVGLAVVVGVVHVHIHSCVVVHHIHIHSIVVLVVHIHSIVVHHSIHTVGVVHHSIHTVGIGIVGVGNAFAVVAHRTSLVVL